MKIYKAWPLERCASLVSESYDRIARWLEGLGQARLLPDWPAELQLKVCRKRSTDRLPDIGTGGVTSRLYLPSRNRKLLFANSTPDLEFLPLNVDGERWYLINPCRPAAGWHKTTSDVEGLPAKDLDGHEHLGKVHWITVIDPHPETLEVFHIKDLRHGAPYLTERLVNRIQSLGLKGLDFTVIGEIVSDPAQASPAPPRPAPPPRRDTPSGKGPKLHLEALRPQEVELIKAERAALAGLGEDPAEIEADITSLKALFDSSDAADGERFAAALQQLHLRIGELLHKRLGWSWQAVVRGRSQRFLAVASPDGAFAVSGGAVVMRQLQTGEPSLQLLLNLIAAGQLPPAQADRVTMLQ